MSHLCTVNGHHDTWKFRKLVAKFPTTCHGSEATGQATSEKQDMKPAAVWARCSRILSVQCTPTVGGEDRYSQRKIAKFVDLNTCYISS